MGAHPRIPVSICLCIGLDDAPRKEEPHGQRMHRNWVFRLHLAK